ncbi:MAG: hypothetical protein ACLQQ4_17890 [Bacteroidia bacterium]
MKKTFLIVFVFIFSGQAYSKTIEVRVAILMNGRKIVNTNADVKIKGLDYYWEVDSSSIIKGMFSKSDSTYDFIVDTKLLNSKALLSVVYDSIEFDWKLNGVESGKDSLSSRNITLGLLFIEKTCSMEDYWLLHYSISSENIYVNNKSTDFALKGFGTIDCTPLSSFRYKRGPGKKWEK